MGKIDYIKSLNKSYDTQIHLAKYTNTGRMICKNYDNINEFWKNYIKLNENQRKYYEIVSLDIEKPLKVRPYFDIEYYTNPEEKKVEEARNYIFLFKKYFEEFINNKNIKIFILDSSGIYYKKKNNESVKLFKHSYHIIISGSGYLKNAQIAGQIAQDFAKWLSNKDRSGVFLASIIDTSVYKSWQLMRLAYSTKDCFNPGDKRILMPLIKCKDNKFRKININRLPERLRYQLFITYTKEENKLWDYKSSNKIIKNNLISVGKKIINDNSDNNNKKNYDKILKLLKCYNDARRNEYYPWIRVGIALYNYFRGNRQGLEIWDNWSKENNCEKYEIGVCNQKWIEFSKNRSNYNIGSLCYWAKLDNNKEYTKIIASQSYSLAYKAISNDYLTAKLIYLMFRHEVKCCVDKKGTVCWYIFTGTIWEEDYRAVYLKKKISKEVTKIYKFLIGQWYKQKEQLANGELPIYLNNSKEKIDTNTEIKKLDEMIKKGYKQLGILTKNITKKQLIDECVIFFNDYNLSSKFNTNPYLMAFNNGVYDFQENKFRSGYPDDMITFSTKIDYIVEQDTKDIEYFMANILPNLETRKYVYYLIASSFPGIISEQVFHFFTGTGGNGKTVLSNILKYSLGDYFMTTISTMFTRKEGSINDATPVKAQLPGKRLLLVSETSKGDKMNETVFKRSSGGDPDIARPLYRPPFEFIPQYTSIMLVNHMPEMDLMDYSILRRTRNVYFPMTFKPKEEINIDNKYEKPIDKRLSNIDYIKLLASQLITLILTKIYPNYIKNGLKPPLEIIKHTNKYKNKMNPFVSYGKEFIEKTDNPDDIIELKELFKKFRTWLYDRRKISPELTSIDTIKNKFSEYYFKQTPHIINKSIQWIGYKFREEYEIIDY